MILKVWNTRAWQKAPLLLSAGTEAVWWVAFSPDGLRIAGGGDNGNVFLWDLQSQQMISRFKAAGDRLIESVGFSATGEELFASDFHQLYIWHAPAVKD